MSLRRLRLPGCLGIFLIALAACASGVQADRGTLEIARGIRLAPPTGWQVRDRTRDSVELVKAAPSGAILARGLITTEARTSAADALQRLADIAAEQPQVPTLTTIAGWPAIERRTTVPMPRTGGGSAAAGPPPTMIVSTVAVAAGSTLVRFEITLSPGSDPRLLDELLGRVRQLDLDAKGDPKQAQRSLDELRRLMRRRLEAAPPPPPAPTAPPGS